MGLCPSKEQQALALDASISAGNKHQQDSGAPDAVQAQAQPPQGAEQRAPSADSCGQPAAAAGGGSHAASPQPGDAPRGAAAPQQGSSNGKAPAPGGAAGQRGAQPGSEASPAQPQQAPAVAAAAAAGAAGAAAAAAAVSAAPSGGPGSGSSTSNGGVRRPAAGAAPPRDAAAAQGSLAPAPADGGSCAAVQAARQPAQPQQLQPAQQMQQQPGAAAAGSPLSQQKQQQLLALGQPSARQWGRAGSGTAPSALAGTGSAKVGGVPTTARSVKFADPVPDSDDGSSCGGDSSERLAGGGSGRARRRSLPRRSASSSGLRSTSTNEVSEAVLAHQAEILRSNKTGKLRMRRGGLDTSFAALQASLTQDGEPVDVVATRAAGLKHIGFGPFKRENQDEFFIQVGDFGGVPGGNLFCVFDGHGSHGKDAALQSRQLLPRLLDMELRQYFMRVAQDTEHALRGAVEVLITEVFGDTERTLTKAGVNLASSGTTASVAFQRGNRLWVAAAGDSRAILCTRNARDQWRALPLTIDHRPRRPSERERIEAAGARVAPKRLPSGRSVGEPRLWLQESGGPGLLLSRSLGDLTAATVGCTSDPEVTYTTLRPHVDQVLVMASDGVWDVLTNEQVCDIVVESPDPHIACRRVLDAALYEWEERMSADNITVLVVEFEWAADAAAPGQCAAGAMRPQTAAMLQGAAPGPFPSGSGPL